MHHTNDLPQSNSVKRPTSPELRILDNRFSVPRAGVVCPEKYLSECCTSQRRGPCPPPFVLPLSFSPLSPSLFLSLPSYFSPLSFPLSLPVCVSPLSLFLSLLFLPPPFPFFFLPLSSVSSFLSHSGETFDESIGVEVSTYGNEDDIRLRNVHLVIPVRCEPHPLSLICSRPYGPPWCQSKQQ